MPMHTFWPAATLMIMNFPTRSLPWKVRRLIRLPNPYLQMSGMDFISEGDVIVVVPYSG